MGMRRKAFLVVIAVFTVQAGITLPAQAQGPSIGGFDPTEGPVGTSVTITGADFTNATDVQFNGTSAPGFSIDSDFQITATVPAGATTGPISVVTPDGTATSAESFTFIPIQHIVIVGRQTRAPGLFGRCPTVDAQGQSELPGEREGQLEDIGPAAVVQAMPIEMGGPELRRQYGRSFWPSSLIE